jgi:gas vesicle protein
MSNQNNKLTTYILGGVIGAALGVVAAILIDQSAELEGKQFSGKKAGKTAMGIIHVLWSLIGKGA